MKVEHSPGDEHDTFMGWNGLVVRILDDGLSIDVYGMIRDGIEAPGFRTKIKGEPTSHHQYQNAPGQWGTPRWPEVSTR